MKKTKSQSKSKIQAKPAVKVQAKSLAKTKMKSKAAVKTAVKTKAGTKSLTKKASSKARSPKLPKAVKPSVKKTGSAKVQISSNTKSASKSLTKKSELKAKPVPPLKVGKSAVKPVIDKKEKLSKAKKSTEKALSKKSVVDETVNESLLDVKAPPILEEPDQAEELILTDAEGRQYCRVKDCDRLAEVEAYCRYHYILLWKNIQTRRHILQEGKLERYIEELTARYPDKFLEILKKDLRTDKDFMAAIQELEIDESAVEAEFDDEESQSDIFEIQRVSDTGGGARSGSDDGDRF